MNVNLLNQSVLLSFIFWLFFFGGFISNRKIGENEKVYERFRLPKEKIHRLTEKR